ncbi:MAG: RlmI/RlmK family 23S rRNA methyltransferase [Alteromonadaceae bacterium]|nr:RlmI/RlmK family 23S rRNA methyltransferase [Alteromonadaceae bacterium]
MQFPPLTLKKNAERRIRAGHLWIYSNEVDTAKTPLAAFEPGTQASVQASNGKAYGVAFVNPHALICGRLVTRDAGQGMTPQLLARRMSAALSLRESVYDRPFYRLVFGDGDGLSGLVIDRFGDICVVQISTAGMELMREQIIEAVHKLLSPGVIVLKNDGKMREIEGLPSYVEVVHGTLADSMLVEENGVPFQAPAEGGQKTGWFYDHRQNRQRLQTYARGKRVLDVFSYVGGWGVQAGVAGASQVTFLDSSAAALEYAAENARNNGLDNAEYLQADAFEALKKLAEEKAERYDLIILDPPALIPRKRDIPQGEAAYARLNELALRLLDKDGMLMSASCSMHLGADRLRDVVRASGRKVDRFVQLLEQGHQSADHPIVPAIPETEYLKALWCRSLSGFY